MADKKYTLNVDVESQSTSLQKSIEELERMVELKKQLKGKVVDIADDDVSKLASLAASQEQLTQSISKQKKVVKEKTEEDLRATAAKQLQSKAEREAIELLKLEAIANDKAAGRMERLEARNRQLTIARKKLSDTDKDYAQTLKFINEELDKNNAEIKSNLDLAGKQQKNIGNYKSALEALPGPLRAAANGVSTLKETFTELLANPLLLTITAIAAALYGLFKAFTSTDEGGTAFAAKMEQVSAVIDVIRQRAASLASGIVNIFTGNWEQAAKDFQDSVAGAGKQLRDAAAAAYEYTYAIDALEDAEIGYISERAKSANKLAKLEFEAANKANSIEARKSALKEAIAIGEEESKKNIEFAKTRYDAEVKYSAAKNNIREDEVRNFIAADDKLQQQLLENSKDLQRFRNNINDEGQQKLEEGYAKVIEADTKFYEEQKRNRAKLSNFELQIDEEREKRKQAELKRVKDISDAKEKELKAEEDRLKRQKKLLEDEQKANRDALAQYEKEVEEANQSAKADGDKLAAERKAKKDKEAEDEKKRLNDLISATDFAVGKINEALDKKSQARLDAIDKEEAANETALDRQKKRADEGLTNDVETYQLKQAELEKAKAEQQKKDLRREKIMSYYNLLSGYAKSDSGSAVKNAVRDIAISEGITAAFAAEGGIVGDVKDTTTLGSSKTHGSGMDRLVLADKREGILTVSEMNNLGGRDGFYNLKAMLNNPISDDVLMPKVPVFLQPKIAGNELERKLDTLISITKNKPVNHTSLDNVGNAITETFESGKKHILKVVSQKPRFRR